VRVEEAERQDSDEDPACPARHAGDEGGLAGHEAAPPPACPSAENEVRQPGEDANEDLVGERRAIVHNPSRPLRGAGEPAPATIRRAQFVGPDRTVRPGGAQGASHRQHRLGLRLES
jgi:hypothetical protein